MKIAVDLPDTVVSARANQQYFKEALVAMLDQTGDLSSREGCEALGMARREFEDMLARFGVSIMPDDDETIAAELNA